MRCRRLQDVLFVVTLTLGLVGGVAGCGSPERGSLSTDAVDATTPEAESEDPAPAADSSSGPLTDTEWQLVEFVSMDDAIGTIRPEDPSVYTMSLASDGTVAMQLNCNRGSGSWTAEAGEDGQSGTFGFGPLATTRALCPPPSMDEQIARDTEHVRGFLLRDGRLYLSLMADAGIYEWEPLAPTPSTDDAN